MYRPMKNNLRLDEHLARVKVRAVRGVRTHLEFQLAEMAFVVNNLSKKLLNLHLCICEHYIAHFIVRSLVNLHVLVNGKFSAVGVL
jgi:hypothetical protein